MKLNAIQIQKAVNGQFIVEPNDTSVFAVRAQIDSRKVQCGDMFVAMSGQNSDGHKFISSAIKLGASVIISEKDLEDEVLSLAKSSSTCIIKVDNSIKALQEIAKQWRRCLRAKVFAITGSTGKTSTKKLCLDVLSSKFLVTANRGNFNNHLGLPITVCEANDQDDYLITEMGMNASGEISALCDIASPEWGLITNCGQAHIERLGSRENIAKAKAELAQKLPDKIGKMFLYADDDYRDFVINYANIQERNIEIILFGANEQKQNFEGIQVWYENLVVDDDGCISFELCIKNKDTVKKQCYLQLKGQHNVINACAAAAVGNLAGMSIEDIVSSLQSSTPEHGRQEILVSKNGVNIINDAYNANPQSMKASIQTFAQLKTQGHKILFLGDMFELGDFAQQAHKDIGAFITENNFDALICVGEMSKNIAQTAEKFGLNKDIIYWSEKPQDALNHLLEIAKPGDSVLFKASNGMGFQKLVEQMVS